MGKSIMPDIRVRNVPPALHKALKMEALERETTLEKLVIEVLQDSIDEWLHIWKNKVKK